MAYQTRSRPDVDAAVRGGDWSQPMDGEGRPQDAGVEHAIYWRKIYREILTMEESVLARIRELMVKQSPHARREVELTNVPVVVAQAERFRRRLGYWDARVNELNGRHKKGFRNPGRRSGQPSATDKKPLSSDQAPGEETVQVNDQYTGGAPAGELKPSEHGQHQTGG